MGGHERGEWASGLIVESIAAARMVGELDADAASLADSIHAANGAIYDEATARGVSTGSTVVALLVSGRRFAVLWAGDSRAYMVRGGQLLQLSRDHTQVQDMVERGLLAQEDAKTHPMGHVLSRAVGVQQGLELEGVTDEVQVGDVFLLCSDGLHGVVSDAEIGRVLSEERPRGACERLVDLCLSRGAPDNVTIVTVACEELTLLSPAGAGLTQS